MIGRRIQKLPEAIDSSLLSLNQCLAKTRKTNKNNVMPGRLVFKDKGG